MTKEEIALQLTLSQVNKLQKTMSTSNYADCEKFNKEIGIQISNLYTSIYENLDCLDSTSNASNQDFISQVI